MAPNPARRVGLCRYFPAEAGCENKADGTVHHDYFGEIPCCTRCADLVGLPLQVTKKAA